MIRILGSSLALLLTLGVASTARSQDFVAGVDPYAYFGSGGPAPEDLPYGGFGHGYVQAPLAGSVLVDRFGGMYTIAPPVSPQVGQAARPDSQPSRVRSRKAPPRPRYALPTGSLYWPGAGAVVMYSPELRYQTYGGGYVRSPYGTLDCGNMWKGWTMAGQ
jgi:hypothetical protein